MKALTLLIQPWGSAVIHWGKPVENRSWAPPRALLGERIAIHAGKKLDEDVLHHLVVSKLAPDVESVPTGAVLGTAVVAGCFETDIFGALKGSVYTSRHHSYDYVAGHATSRWTMPDGWAWVLAEPRALTEPVPCRGAQGLWTLPVEVERLVTEREVQRG